MNSPLHQDQQNRQRDGLQRACCSPWPDIRPKRDTYALAPFDNSLGLGDGYLRALYGRPGLHS